MTSAHRETAPNPRRDYLQEWINHPTPTDRAETLWEDGTPRLIASPTQIEAARIEMNRDKEVQVWADRVAQYPRTVLGKFYTADNAGFNEIGIEGGQSQGAFLRRLMPEGTNMERLIAVLSGANGDYAIAADHGADFVIPERPINAGDREFYPLTFLQFQHRAYSQGGHRRSHVPITTTFYLPPEVAPQLFSDIHRNPDIMPGIFERAVAPGMPEPIYRTPSNHIGIVDMKTLRAAEKTSGYKQQQFEALWRTAEWRKYAQQHGGETPQLSR